MPREVEILAGVSEAAAAHIESARFGNDADNDEDRHQRRYDKYPTAIENARDQGKAAKNFQPWEIQRQKNAELPGQHFVVVDISRELHRLDDLDHAGVNE